MTNRATITLDDEAHTFLIEAGGHEQKRLYKSAFEKRKPAFSRECDFEGK